MNKFDKYVDARCGLLDLFDCSFDSQDLQLLHSHYLTRSHTHISGSEEVTVVGLRFGHTAIDLAGAENIATALLSPHCTLQKLQFLRNELGSESISVIASSLVENVSLIALEVVDDEVTVMGMRAVAASLLHNRALQSLSLINSSITSGSGLDALRDSLRVNTTLHTLE
jgi:hypothetical protein